MQWIETWNIHDIVMCNKLLINVFYFIVRRSESDVQ